MTDGSRLELLLPELQLQILSHLDSFHTLRALVLASPRLYQVYQSNKQVLLSSIARRVSHIGAICHALAIERLKQLEQPPFSRSSVLSVLESFPDPKDQAGTVLPLTTSIHLCKLYVTVQFFVDDYARNTLPILSQLRNSKDASIEPQYGANTDNPPHLSTTELSRLQRAFCRFETYRQLFARCSSTLNHETYPYPCTSDPPFTVFEQGQLFFGGSPLYRIAEIACVRDYLYRRLFGIFDQVENEVVQSLQSQIPFPGDNHPAKDWKKSVGERYGYFEEDHIFTYAEKYNQGDYIEHLLSLGLPYIKKILGAAGEERKDLLLRSNIRYNYPDHIENCFLTGALGLNSLIPGKELYGWGERARSPDLEQEDQLDIPPGWRWAHVDRYYTGLVDLASEGLRDWGYVFWDLDRLQSTGVLDLE